MTPGRVVVFWGWKTTLAPARNPRSSTPLTRVTITTTTMALPMNSATSSPMCQRRISSRANVLIASLISRAPAISTQEVPIATGSVSMYVAVAGPSMLISAATSRCQAAAGTSISSDAPIAVAMTPPWRAFRIRGAGGHHRRRRRISARAATATSTPMPYPMAALIPPMIPPVSQSRGSSEGVSDRQNNSAANATPVKSRRTRLQR